MQAAPDSLDAVAQGQEALLKGSWTEAKRAFEGVEPSDVDRPSVLTG